MLIAKPNALVKSFFSMLIPLDLRTKYTDPPTSDTTAGARRLLQQNNVTLYFGYLAYPLSTSVVRQTLRAYWLSGGTTWLLVPTQSLSPDGASISMQVTRQMVLGSLGGKVVIAAFAVSQPPEPTKTQAQTQQQIQRLQILALLISIQVADTPYVSKSPAPAPAPTPATPQQTTPLPSTSPPPPPPPPPDSSSALDPGAVAGVVIACIAVVGAISAIFYWKLARPAAAAATVSATATAPAYKPVSVAPSAPPAPRSLTGMFQDAGAALSVQRYKHPSSTWKNFRRTGA